MLPLWEVISVNLLSTDANHSACAIWGTKCLRLLKHWPWDRGFESYSKNGYLSVFILCLCSLVLVESLRHADHPSKESYKLYIISELILNANEPEELHQGRTSYKYACINCSVTRGPVSWTYNIQHNIKTNYSFQKAFLNKHFPWKQRRRCGRSTYRKNYFAMSYRISVL
jgi:hypothetical protein